MPRQITEIIFKGQNFSIGKNINNLFAEKAGILVANEHPEKYGIIIPD